MQNCEGLPNGSQGLSRRSHDTCRLNPRRIGYGPTMNMAALASFPSRALEKPLPCSPGLGVHVKPRARRAWGAVESAGDVACPLAMMSRAVVAVFFFAARFGPTWDVCAWGGAYDVGRSFRIFAGKAHRRKSVETVCICSRRIAFGPLAARTSGLHDRNESPCGIISRCRNGDGTGLRASPRALRYCPGDLRVIYSSRGR